MKNENFKRKRSLFFSAISLGLCLSLLLDILLFPLQSWVTGNGFDTIILHESFFWVQYVTHCTYFSPTYLGLSIWIYWYIPFIISLSIYVKLQNPNISSKFKVDKKIEFNRILDSSPTIVFVINLIIFCIYLTKSGIITHVLLLFRYFPFGIILFFSAIVLLPMKICSLLHKELTPSNNYRKSDSQFFIIILIICNFFFAYFGSKLLFGGCI